MKEAREKQVRKLVNAIDAVWGVLKYNIEIDGKNDVGYCGIDNYTRHKETIINLRIWLNELAKVIESNKY